MTNCGGVAAFLLGYTIIKKDMEFASALLITGLNIGEISFEPTSMGSSSFAAGSFSFVLRTMATLLKASSADWPGITMLDFLELIRFPALSRTAVSSR